MIHQDESLTRELCCPFIGICIFKLQVRGLGIALKVEKISSITSFFSKINIPKTITIHLIILQIQDYIFCLRNNKFTRSSINVTKATPSRALPSPAAALSWAALHCSAAPATAPPPEQPRSPKTPKHEAGGRACPTSGKAWVRRARAVRPFCTDLRKLRRFPQRHADVNSHEERARNNPSFFGGAGKTPTGGLRGLKPGSERPSGAEPR